MGHNHFLCSKVKGTFRTRATDENLRAFLRYDLASRFAFLWHFIEVGSAQQLYASWALGSGRLWSLVAETKNHSYVVKYSLGFQGGRPWRMWLPNAFFRRIPEDGEIWDLAEFPCQKWLDLNPSSSFYGKEELFGHTQEQNCIPCRKNR